MGYDATRDRVEGYFDRTATQVWERLTSDAPVSRIRETVRHGRDAMRARMMAALPQDLTGLTVLDAGCGPGVASIALAERGARVTGVDISPALIEIAKRRTPEALRDRITYVAGDMLDPAMGGFDHVFAMDSLIYYDPSDIRGALAALKDRTRRSVVFTVAPRTPLLMAMWHAGRLFPRADRSPTMVPHAPSGLMRDLGLNDLGREAHGFYISHALELRA